MNEKIKLSERAYIVMRNDSHLRAALAHLREVVVDDDARDELNAIVARVAIMQRAHEDAIETFEDEP